MLRAVWLHLPRGRSRTAAARAVFVLAMLATSVGCTIPPSVIALPEIPWPDGGAPTLNRPPLVERPSVDLPPPGGLRAHSGAFRRIPLQWDPMLDLEVGGYLVEVAAEREGPFEALVPVWGRGRLALVAGDPVSPLGDGETRFYRLRAFSPDGRLSIHASQVVVGTTAPLPDAPTGLRAYSRQPREVPLAWSVSTDPTVTGYRLERSPGQEGPWEVIANLDDRHQASFVDEGLGDLRVFYYRVSAENGGGALGPPADPVRAVTKPKPLPPLGLRLAHQGLGVNVLTWEPNVERDILAYRLYREESDGQQRAVASALPNELTIADTSVGAGESAAYTLIALDRTRLVSRPSVVVHAEGTDYGLTSNPSPDGVWLQWNPRPEEGFVRAYIERATWRGVEVLGSTGAGVYVDREIKPGGSYQYRVILEHADGSQAPPSKSIDVDVPELDAIR